MQIRPRKTHWILQSNALTPILEALFPLHILNLLAEWFKKNDYLSSWGPDLVLSTTLIKSPYCQGWRYWIEKTHFMMLGTRFSKADFCMVGRQIHLCGLIQWTNQDNLLLPRPFDPKLFGTNRRNLFSQVENSGFNLALLSSSAHSFGSLTISIALFLIFCATDKEHSAILGEVKICVNRDLK